MVHFCVLSAIKFLKFWQRWNTVLAFCIINLILYLSNNPFVNSLLLKIDAACDLDRLITYVETEA